MSFGQPRTEHGPNLQKSARPGGGGGEPGEAGVVNSEQAEGGGGLDASTEQSRHVLVRTEPVELPRLQNIQKLTDFDKWQQT